MAVNTTENKAGPYDCDGATDSFPFPYKILSENDLVVTLTSPEGVDTVLTIGSDYTVSREGATWDNGAVVTTTQVYSGGYKITIVREIPLLQTTDYLANDIFPAEVHENDHDKIMMIAQQIANRLASTVRFPTSDPSGINAILPALAARVSKFLAFNAEGEIIAAVGSNPSGVPVTEAATTILDDETITDILTTLGFSAFIKTLIDDADETTARTTLGAVSQEDFTAFLKDIKPIYYMNWINSLNQWWDNATGHVRGLHQGIISVASVERPLLYAAGIYNASPLVRSGAFSYNGINFYPDAGTPAYSMYTVCSKRVSGSVWILGGQSGNLYSGTPGGTWTARTSNFGSDDINTSCYSPTLDLFVIGGNNGKLSTSQDGITWTARTSQFGTDAIYRIAWGNGMFVAVGGGGKISTSTNGIDWTARTSGVGSQTLRTVAFGNGIFIATGNLGDWTGIKSSDGITWTKINNGYADDYSSGLLYNPDLKHWFLFGSSSVYNHMLVGNPDATLWTKTRQWPSRGQERCWEAIWMPEYHRMAACGDQRTLIISHGPSFQFPS